MQNKIFKKLNQYHYKRCFLVLILFVLAFVFGENMNVLTLEQQQLQDLVYTQQKMTFGIYDVTADQQEYELKNQFVLKNGQCGRLFFSLRNLPPINKSPDSSIVNPNIKILLSSDLNQNQELGSYEIKSNRFVQNEEVDFCSNTDYSGLLFQKNNDQDNQDYAFEISSVAFFPIAIEKHDLNNLLPSIIGNTNFNNIIYQSSFESKDANTAIKFSRKNQLIGQTFIASSDTASGVDLKLEFIGGGGIGNYFLDLREVNDQGGKLVISSNRMAYYCFNKGSAEKNLKIEEKVYHIPLAAHLEKGKTYFIGISNESVKFNILNTLKIYGGSEDTGSDKIITSVGGRTSEKPGSLYLKVYGSDYTKVGDEKVLNGAKVLDNGDETGLYNYQQKGNFSDYLDLDQLISKGNNDIFYDNVQSGVSGRDENDNAFVYKINTTYSFTRMKIEANQPGEDFINSLVYYSFDEKKWQEIKSDSNKEDASSQENKDKFQELVYGDGKTKTLFIKVTYDKADAIDKKVHLFGLRNLKVTAELNLR